MAAQALEAVFFAGDDQKRRDFTPSGAAVVQGEIVLSRAVRADGPHLPGYCTSPEGIADGALGSLGHEGLVKVSKDDGAAVTFTAGDPVEWDEANSLAVAATLGDEDIGIAAEDAAAGDNFVLVEWNKGAPDA